MAQQTLWLSVSPDSYSTLQGHSRKKWRTCAWYPEVLPASNWRNPKVAGPLAVVCFSLFICPSCSNSHTGWCRALGSTREWLFAWERELPPGTQLHQKMSWNSSLTFSQSSFFLLVGERKWLSTWEHFLMWFRNSFWFGQLLKEPGDFLMSSGKVGIIGLYWVYFKWKREERIHLHVWWTPNSGFYWYCVSPNRTLISKAHLPLPHPALGPEGLRGTSGRLKQARGGKVSFLHLGIGPEATQLGPHGSQVCWPPIALILKDLWCCLFPAGGKKTAFLLCGCLVLYFSLWR